MKQLPHNVRILGWTSFLNDVASEMIYPLLPQFLIVVLGGNKFHLGIIEGAAESIASFNKVWAGAWSDRAGYRKPFIVFGYSVAAIARPIIGLGQDTGDRHRGHGDRHRGQGQTPGTRYRADAVVSCHGVAEELQHPLALADWLWAHSSTSISAQFIRPEIGSSL
jgi:hypothetical protein